jgi:hypothetical protein
LYIVAEAVVEGVVEGVVEEAMIPVFTIKSIGRIRNSTSATRKGIHKNSVPISRMTTTIILWQELLAALRKSRRILNPLRKHSPRSTLSLHS